MSSEPAHRAIAERFGENLRHCRRMSGLSQEETAFRANLHRTEIGLLERGERVPRLDTVVRLAGAVSVMPAVLLEGIAWEVPTRNPGRMKIEPRGNG